MIDLMMFSILMEVLGRHNYRRDGRVPHQTHDVVLRLKFLQFQHKLLNTCLSFIPQVFTVEHLLVSSGTAIILVQW